MRPRPADYQMPYSYDCYFLGGLQNGRALTNREWQIVLMVRTGLSNKSIARRLNLSEGTVKVHLHNIYTKLGVKNRTALAIAHIQREELICQ